MNVSLVSLTWNTFFHQMLLECCSIHNRMAGEWLKSYLQTSNTQKIYQTIKRWKSCPVWILTPARNYFSKFYSIFALWSLYHLPICLEVVTAFLANRIFFNIPRNKKKHEIKTLKPGFCKSIKPKIILVNWLLPDIQDLIPELEKNNIILGSYLSIKLYLWDNWYHHQPPNQPT